MSVMPPIATKNGEPVMTDNLHRTCPHCGGRNTSYFMGIEEAVWFTTKYETADGFGLFACNDTNPAQVPQSAETGAN